jgi:hypothetical protein
MLDSDQKKKLLREHFPQLGEDKIENIETFLDEYCELILRIFDRLEREQGVDFDRDSRVS